MVSVSWDPSVYINGPLLSYRLSLHSLADPSHVTRVEVSPRKTSWIFGYLDAGTEYEISVLAVNGVGKGPAQRASVSTPQISKRKCHIMAKVIVTLNFASN